MSGFVAKVSDGEDNLLRQLPLQIEIPLLHVRTGEVRIHRHHRRRKVKYFGRPLLRCGGCGPFIVLQKLKLLGTIAVWIRELNIESCQAIRKRLRSSIRVQRDKLDGIGKNSVTAANTSLAVAERIVG